MMTYDFLKQTLIEELKLSPYPIVKAKYLQYGYSEALLDQIYDEIHYKGGRITTQDSSYSRDPRNSIYSKYYEDIKSDLESGVPVKDVVSKYVNVSKTYIYMVANQMGISTSGTNVAKNTYAQYHAAMAVDISNGMNISELYNKYSYTGMSKSGMQKMIKKYGNGSNGQRNHFLDIKEPILERIKNGETPEAVYEDYKDTGITLKRIKVWCRDVLGVYMTANTRDAKADIVADIKAGMRRCDLIAKYPQVSPRTISTYRTQVKRGEL